MGCRAACRRLLPLAAVLLICLPGRAAAQAILSATPARLALEPVGVGGSVEATVEILNSGTATASVTDIRSIVGNASLTASPASFSLAAGQSQTVTVTFAPTKARDLADGLKVTANATVLGSTAPNLTIPVTGVATGPRLTLSRSRLTFTARRTGIAARDTVILGNDGNEPLDVLSLVTTKTAFTLNTTPFTLTPGDTQSVIVTYTPATTPPVTDTLSVLTNSPDGPLRFVALDAKETPTKPRTARLSVLRTGGTGTPGVGDTIRVALVAFPKSDTLRGVEAFVSFDATLLEAVKGSGPLMGPFDRSTLTQSVGFQINRVEGTGSGAAAHLSTVFAQNKRAADTLAVMRLAVKDTIRDDLTIRVLTENPLRNTKFLTPANVSVAMPGSTRVNLGNRPPVIRPFEILSPLEDSTFTIDLTARATDTQTGALGLTWLFEGLAGLFDVTVEKSETAQTATVTLPQDGFGVFDLLAIVRDPGGLSDTAAVILDVRPSNDPPNVPVYSAPADGMEGLEIPVEMRWTGGDPEGDAVTYEVRVGTTEGGLQPIATDVTAPSYDAGALGAGTTYFWQIVTVDAGGARTEGEIRRFTTAPDVTAPVFLTPPRDTLVTASTALVVWDTNETSTSTVRIGLSASLADSADFAAAGNQFLVLRHEVQLSGLVPNTTYFYRAASRDLFGNETGSAIGSFTTSTAGLGDFDDSGTIDFADFVVFGSAYNTSDGDAAFNARADFDANGRIDFADFLAFAAVFGS